VRNIDDAVTAGVAPQATCREIAEVALQNTDTEKQTHCQHTAPK
jgi:hypothetical protein